MSLSITTLISTVLLAQADAEGPGLGQMLVPMLLIIPLFWFMIIRPEKRKQAAQKSLLEGMKKSDRVVTAGGIKGVVSSVNRNTDEITLVVDESNGTKMRFTIGSVIRVETDESNGDKNKK